MQGIALVAAAIWLALVAAAPAQNAPVSPSPVKRTIISKIEVPNSNYEVITALLEIAPGFKAGRHLHPGVVNGYVTEGQFWLAIEGQPEKTLNPGDGATVPNRAIHNEGAIGDKPLKAIVTYVVEKGQPLVVPVKD
ncbi:MAG TPA: cupin domain-containing protein [Pseudorhodoplanes sp.]|jgi:quercetin dioxygenase-like cupin family protein|nr:cupin domain-containing protein [Pseudorhodoplanes sp.]